jgi:hypothetical protein
MRPAPPRVTRRGWAPFSNRRYRHPRAHPLMWRFGCRPAPALGGAWVPSNTPAPRTRVERSLTPWGSREAGRHPQAELMPLAVRRDPRCPSVTQHVPELLAVRKRGGRIMRRGRRAGIDFLVGQRGRESGHCRSKEKPRSSGPWVNCSNSMSGRGGQPLRDRANNLSLGIASSAGATAFRLTTQH